MTILFEYACQAERDVQGRLSKQYSNSFEGQSLTSSSAPALQEPSTPTTTPIKRTAEPAGASSCAYLEPSLHNSPNTPTANISNVHGATLMLMSYIFHKSCFS
jgi:hypothetical protein